MLIEFRVENFRSIRDEQVFTLEEGRGGADDDPRPREVGHGRRVLPVAALYGANGSGKSNLLSALRFMWSAVRESHANWPPRGGVPREPFAWGPKVDEPSLFEVTVLIDEVRYQYGFVIDNAEVLEEWLFSWPGARKRVLFERDRRSFHFGGHLQGENRSVEQLTRPNALFLSTAVQLNHQQLTPLYDWFMALVLLNVPGGDRASFMARGFALDRYIIEIFETARAHAPSAGEPPDDAESEGHVRARFQSLLQLADLGILESEFRDQEAGGGGFFVRHSTSVGDGWLPLAQESQGTLTLFRIVPQMLIALEVGSVVLVDELEASLHPLLGAKLVELFNDPRSNPHNAQLIFTTHDTNLLGTIPDEPALRRDQVWLVEKDKDGASTIYPLTDFKPRKSENLERGYLQGRYGAIPFLGDLALWEK